MFAHLISLFLYLFWINLKGTNALGVRNVITKVAGDNVRLACYANKNTEVSWQFIPLGLKYRITISAEGQLLANDSGRYSLDIDIASKRHDLVIQNVRIADTGLYFCNQIKSETRVKLIIEKYAKRLEVVPVDTAVLVGHDARLNCSTSYQRPVFWEYNPSASTEQLNIYIGDTRVMDERHSMEINEIAGQYDLVIKNVEMSDAGKYFCVDDSGYGLRVSAELVVLGSSPLCLSNVSTDGFIVENDCGLEPDYAKVCCIITFSGNVAPTLLWKRRNITVGNTTTGLIKSDQHYTEATSFVFKADFKINEHPFVCEINESLHLMTNNECKIPETKIHYMFNSTAIGQHKTISSTSPPTRLTCTANASDQDHCSYTWIEINQPNQILVQNQFVSLPNPGFLSGKYYQCIAWCNIKGTNCSFPSFSFLMDDEVSVKDKENTDSDSVTIVVGTSTAAGLFVAIVALVVTILCRECRMRKHLKKTFGEFKQLMPKGSVNYRTVSIKKRKRIPSLCGHKNEIRGLAVLHPNIYAVRHKEKVIEVINSETFEFQSSIKADGLVNVRDMVSCRINKCLYTSDEYNTTIQRFQLPMAECSLEPGKYTESWLMKDKPEGLSVTSEGHLLVTFFEVNKIRIYKTNGEFIEEIILHDSIKQTWHACQLESHLIVSHGNNERGAGSNRVCLVNKTDQSIIRCYDGINNKPLSRPLRIAPTGNGFVYVTDYENNIILLLDPDLEVVKEFGCELPTRICLDRKRKRLYVALDDVTGTICVFDLVSD